jgi:magnesium-transporting ATPase (P-type)
MENEFRDLTRKKIINNIWVIVWVVSIIWSILTFVALIYLIFFLPSNALATSKDYTLADIYPKRFGLYNAWVTVEWWINPPTPKPNPGDFISTPHVAPNFTMWLSLTMILIIFLFVVILLRYARYQTRGWFNKNSYIRIVLIMLFGSISLFILGVTAHPVISDVTSPDIDVPWDYSWESWIFKHNSDPNKLYTFTIAGTSLLTFIILVSVYAAIDGSLSVFVSVSRYRDWVRHNELW